MEEPGKWQFFLYFLLKLTLKDTLKKYRVTHLLTDRQTYTYSQPDS